jgi:hypothetical protein
VELLTSATAGPWLTLWKRLAVLNCFPRLTLLLRAVRRQLMREPVPSNEVAQVVRLTGPEGPPLPFLVERRNQIRFD